MLEPPCPNDNCATDSSRWQQPKFPFFQCCVALLMRQTLCGKQYSGHLGWRAFPRIFPAYTFFRPFTAPGFVRSLPRPSAICLVKKHGYLGCYSRSDYHWGFLPGPSQFLSSTESLLPRKDAQHTEKPLEARRFWMCLDAKQYYISLAMILQNGS